MASDILMRMYAPLDQQTQNNRISKRIIVRTILVFLIGIVLVEFGLSRTLYNPAMMIPAYDWAVRVGLWRAVETVVGTETEFPVVALSVIANGRFRYPHACTAGKVHAKVQSRYDKDWHLNLRDRNGTVLVAEISPYHPIQSIPSVEQWVTVCGVVRYDSYHRWWEINPVFWWVPASGG